MSDNCKFGSQDSGCMTCTSSVSYTKSTTNEFLEPGDHVEILMKNKLTYHHAIVEEFKDLGNEKGKIKVIDVTCKKAIKEKSGKKEKDESSDSIHPNGSNRANTDENNPESIEIFVGRNLVVRRLHLPSPITGSIEIDLKDVRRVDYQKRKFDKKKTFDRAEKFVTELSTLPIKIEPDNNDTRVNTANKHNESLQLNYNLCIQNCEHFAVACVNGDEPNVEECFSKSTSLQVVRFWWILMNILFVLCMTVGNVLSVLIYVQFIEKRTDKVNGMNAFAFCGNNVWNSIMGNDCDFFVVGMFDIGTLLLYTAKVWCLHKKTVQCKACIYANVVVLIFKFLLIFMFQLAFVLFEKVFSLLLVNTNNFTLMLFVVILSVFLVSLLFYGMISYISEHVFFWNTIYILISRLCDPASRPNQELQQIAADNPPKIASPKLFCW